MKYRCFKCVFVKMGVQASLNCSSLLADEVLWWADYRSKEVAVSSQSCRKV